jgi:peptidoglycan/xylan/chitin deacetylase (PgdA/CDA1 family)
MRWSYRRGLRVLMYHRTSLATADEQTVTAAQLERQLRWLHERGFVFVTVEEVLRGSLPEWPVLVTFDDAYVSTLEVAAPVLRDLKVPGAIFVPTAFVGQTSSWDADARPLMDGPQLRTLASGGFEIGLHSHRHENYARYFDAAQVAEDVRASFTVLRELGISPVPALAYPYGGRPRDWSTLCAMKKELWQSGVHLAFRIGNRINEVPLRDPFEIQRLSVRGDESFSSFQRKIRWGRLLG